MSDVDQKTHVFFDAKSNDRPPLPFSEFFRNGMGTEHVAPFLYSIVRMVRPIRLLEIGSGYTTPWLLSALEHNESVHIDWNADPEYYKQPYEPVLVCIDDGSETIPENRKDISDLSKSPYLRLIESKFQSRAAGLAAEYGKFDFVWFDCGGPTEYEEFCCEYLPFCSGYVFFHFTYLHGNPTRNLEIIESHLQRFGTLPSDGPNEPGWDRIDFVEPHKYRQGSVTVLRRRVSRSDSSNGEAI